MLGGAVGARVGIGGKVRTAVGSSMENGFTEGASVLGADVVDAAGTTLPGLPGAGVEATGGGVQLEVASIGVDVNGAIDTGVLSVGVEGTVAFVGAEVVGDVAFVGAEVVGIEAFVGAEIVGIEAFVGAKVVGTVATVGTEVTGTVAFVGAEVGGTGVAEGVKVVDAMVTVGIGADMAQASVRPPSIHVALPSAKLGVSTASA